MKRLKNRVLIVSPHMDDEVLGCGGIISKHSRSDRIWVVFVANRVYDHIFSAQKNYVEKSHAMESKKALGYHEAIFLDMADERLDSCVQEIIIPLEKLTQKIKPHVVYLPFRGDNNQDHRAVFDASRVVLRPSAVPFVNTIRMYEVPSSTEQSPPLLENAFIPNYYADIGGVIKKKIAAMKCYSTEQRPYPHPRSPDAIKILAQKRGIEIGFKYAEAFMTIREKNG